MMGFSHVLPWVNFASVRRSTTIACHKKLSQVRIVPTTIASRVFLRFNAALLGDGMRDLSCCMLGKTVRTRRIADHWP